MQISESWTNVLYVKWTRQDKNSLWKQPEVSATSQMEDDSVTLVCQQHKQLKKSRKAVRLQVQDTEIQLLVWSSVVYNLAISCLLVWIFIVVVWIFMMWCVCFLPAALVTGYGSHCRQLGWYPNHRICSKSDKKHHWQSRVSRNTFPKKSTSLIFRQMMW